MTMTKTRSLLAKAAAVLVSLALVFTAWSASSVAALAETVPGVDSGAVDGSVGEPGDSDGDGAGSSDASLPEEAKDPEATQEEEPVQESTQAAEQDEAAGGISARAGPDGTVQDGTALQQDGAQAARCYVTFYSGPAGENPSILARTLASAEAGSTATVSVSDVTAPAPDAASVFSGWSYQGATVKESIEVDPQNGDVELYPVFDTGHWLRFEYGRADNVAYLSNIFVPADADARSVENLPTTTRTGYSFDGWFDGTMQDGAVVYGARVSDASGNVADPERLRDLLGSSDVTLYAKWVGAASSFTVASWVENADDDGYAYLGSHVVRDSMSRPVRSGATTDVSAADGFELEGFELQPIKQQSIAGDGSTVVNLYYDRAVYSVQFHSSRAANSPVVDALTITAKFGADIHDMWPGVRPDTDSYTASWYTHPLNAGGTAPNDVFVSGIGTMPLGGARFYPRDVTGVGYGTVFRTQTLEAAMSGTDGYADYVEQQHTSAVGETTSTTADDYRPIVGFTVNAASDGDAGEIRANPVGDANATHNGTFATSAPVGAVYNTAGTLVTDASGVQRHTLYFYYLRNQYSVVFNENGGAAVDNVDGVFYEEPLAGRAPQDYVVGQTVKVDGSGAVYSFEGWFDNEDLIGSPFDFEAATMPASNIVLHAKWEPKSHLVQIDPVGGELAGNFPGTYLGVEHGFVIGAVTATRDYVADDDGGFVYRYETADSDDDGFGEARYVAAQPGDAGQRYSRKDGAYELFGWFEVVDGEVATTPFDFSAPITKDTSVVAKWRATGSFDIAYDPSSTVDGVTVSGEIDRVLDAGYADLSPTYVANTSRDITSDTGGAYAFEGWRVVSGFEDGASVLDDTLYVEGDAFTVNSELARDGVIHLQAVYKLLSAPIVPAESELPDAGDGGEGSAASAGGAGASAESGAEAKTEGAATDAVETGDAIMNALPWLVGAAAAFAAAIALLAGVFRGRKEE